MKLIFWTFNSENFAATIKFPCFKTWKKEYDLENCSKDYISVASSGLVSIGALLNGATLLIANSGICYKFGRSGNKQTMDCIFVEHGNDKQTDRGVVKQTDRRTEKMRGKIKINFLLTEREGRTGEYWPEVVAVRAERSEVRTKRPRANIPRYGSS